ncbi:MAG: RagB/SusD family nutrient uptake outer membrane protein, partial [Candidatus Saccharimonadales bacterium]
QSWGDSWNPPGGELGWIDSFSWPSEITGEGYDYGSPALYYSYQTGDTRKLATIIGPGDPNMSPGIIAAWGGIKGYPNVVGGFAAYKADPNDISDKNRYSDGNGNIINTNGTLAHPWYGTDGTPRSGFVCEKKWRDPSLTGGSGAQAIFGSQNQVLMRYAEVLLSRAECEVRLGMTAQALADINKVRTRAFGGTPPAMWQDGWLPQADAQGNPIPAPVITDPMQMVMSEYRHELSGDYSLMYLLRRAGIDPATKVPYDAEMIHLWNTGPAAQYAYGKNPASFINFPYGPTHDTNTANPANHGVTSNDLPLGRDILPIPQSDIGLNPNLKQNPGY